MRIIVTSKPRGLDILKLEVSDENNPIEILEHLKTHPTLAKYDLEQVTVRIYRQMSINKIS